MEALTVSWFSAGVSSAVATKLYIDKIDKIIYIDIPDHHPDNTRFIKECESWFGKPIEIIQNDMSVDYVCRKMRYINGVKGAPCTKILKREVRKKYEYENDISTYIWGMDVDEKHRCSRIIESMPNQKHVFPLIDKGIDKQEAHMILKASGIKRPMMYDLGYYNNNCVGCVKGRKGYWNKIRVDFPEVFESRMKLEDHIGASINNGIRLADLNPDEGRGQVAIDDDCGIFCELKKL